jgi:endonuclease III
MSKAVTIGEEIHEQFDEIERLLDVEYGPRLLRPGGDPLSTLIGTILSQSTSDVNSSRAMASLQEEFPTWEEVRDAPVEDVIEAIRMGGLANTKGPRIQAVLRAVTEERPDLDLGFLSEMTVEDAMGWLTALDGVGPKTAACVLLFALGMPAMPVDTHVGRVMTRLGVLPGRTSTATKQRLLEEMIGPEPQRVYAVHVETIAHGRRICRSQRPQCNICPLKEHCDYGQSILG